MKKLLQEGVESAFPYANTKFIHECLDERDQQWEYF